MSRWVWVVRKDLALFFSDKSGAAMVIVVPLVLGIMMGLLFQPGEGTPAMVVGVVDGDGGPEVQALIARLNADAALKIERLPQRAARERVKTGKLAVALVFAPGTGKQLTATAMFSGKQKGVLTLWVDPSRGIEADIVRGLLTKAMMETVFAQVSDPTRLSDMFTDLLRSAPDVGAERPALQRFLQQGRAFAEEDRRRRERAPPPTAAQPKDAAMSLQPPLEIRLEPVVAAGPTAGFNGHAHTFAGMLMQFLLFMAISSAKGLFREREAGTLDRLRMTATPPRTILLGAAGAVAIVSLLSTAVIFGVGVLFFHIELRSGVPAFVLVSVAQAVFMGAFMLLMVGLVNSDKQLDGVGVLVVLSLCFVSGAWVPAFMLPNVLQSAGPIIPTRWILDGFAGATWRGLGWMHAVKTCGALLAFSAVFAAVGLKRFRWS